MNKLKLFCEWQPIFHNFVFYKTKLILVDGKNFVRHQRMLINSVKDINQKLWLRFKFVHKIVILPNLSRNEAIFIIFVFLNHIKASLSYKIISCVNIFSYWCALPWKSIFKNILFLTLILIPTWYLFILIKKIFIFKLLVWRMINLIIFQ